MFDLRSWLHPGLAVLPSPIHGNGVFTNELLTAGEPVVRWGGVLVPGTNVADAAIPVKDHTAVGVAEGVLLAVLEGGDYTIDDFMNHSCEPNVGMADAITLVTMRDIHAGEELVADYAMWTSDETYVMRNACRCGAVLCRGTITGRDWRTPELHERYGPFFSPFLQRRYALK